MLATQNHTGFQCNLEPQGGAAAASLQLAGFSLRASGRGCQCARICENAGPPATRGRMFAMGWRNRTTARVRAPFLRFPELPYGHVCLKGSPPCRARLLEGVIDRVAQRARLPCRAFEAGPALTVYAACLAGIGCHGPSQRPPPLLPHMHAVVGGKLQLGLDPLGLASGRQAVSVPPRTPQVLESSEMDGAIMTALAAEVLTTKALEFLDGYKEDDRPFFLYLAPCEFGQGRCLA
jgi:hypothetical protein